MKKLLLLLLVVVVTSNANKLFSQEVSNGAKIEFEKEIHDYGTVEYAGNGQCTFKFTNTGNAPLIISNAKGSCGCTVPSWPKEPVAPGASSSLSVKYDTKRPGAINKSVTITSNAVNSPTKVIRIKGTVKPKPSSGAPINKTGAPANK
ncbi:MAG: hypothetical protein CL844_03325 [Crocinitomicaceae bacterium]|nr:hypothetical protein [Crocinitomicaceae bacterium]|tara:strand:- start:90473 stop:90916 length:444 start_codon:yes stop_codon:yes gene_type:complete